MINQGTDINLKVYRARLLTKQEFVDYEYQLPEISSGCTWWLEDIDDYGDVAYAEGNYTDDDMYCSKDEANTWIRVALDIEGDVSAGDEFVYCGYVFTALSDDLAISNNFLGCAKYLDEEILPYVEDDCDECTIGAIINTMISVETSSDDDDCDDDYDDDEEGSVEVFNVIDDDTLAELGVLDLNDSDADEQYNESELDYYEDLEMLCPYCEAELVIPKCKDGDRIKCAVCEKTFTLNPTIECPECGELVFYDPEYDTELIMCDSCGCEFEVDSENEYDDEGAIISISSDNDDSLSDLENDDEEVATSEDVEEEIDISVDTKDDFSIDDLLSKHLGSTID